MLYLHPSATETELLPYFLFAIYSAIVYFVRREAAAREYVQPEPIVEIEIAPTADFKPAPEIESYEVEYIGNFDLAIPCPWTESLEHQFQQVMAQLETNPEEIIISRPLPQLPPAKQPSLKAKKRRSTLNDIIALELAKPQEQA